jgi:hypothetical protein
VCFTGWTKLITAECIPYGTASCRCSKNKDVIARGLVIAPTFQLVKSHSAAPGRLPEFVEPMQAKLVHSMRTGDWIYEIKFDGYRALALRGGTETRILSRSENWHDEVQLPECSFDRVRKTEKPEWDRLRLKSTDLEAVATLGLIVFTTEIPD